MFGMKKRNQPNIEKPINYATPPTQKVVHVEEQSPRPCWVKGKKAIFHRWCNNANPVLPRGVEPDDEKARYFQYRSVQAVVEYMDGTVERVYPQQVKFADGGRFDEMTWLPATQLEDE